VILVIFVRKITHIGNFEKLKVKRKVDWILVVQESTRGKISYTGDILHVQSGLIFLICPFQIFFVYFSFFFLFLRKRS